MTLPVIIVLAIAVIVLAYALGVYLRRRGELPALSRRSSLPKLPSAANDRETRAVVGWLLNQAFEQTGIRVAEDKVAYQRILEAAYKAIQDLKTQQAVTISLPFLTADPSGPKHLEVRLTREAIEELVRY
ncbi:MAG: Hsp70 family protein [Anaerolineales bacterium]